MHKIWLAVVDANIPHNQLSMSESLSLPCAYTLPRLGLEGILASVRLCYVAHNTHTSLSLSRSIPLSSVCGAGVSLSLYPECLQLCCPVVVASVTVSARTLTQHRQYDLTPCSAQQQNTAPLHSPRTRTPLVARAHCTVCVSCVSACHRLSQGLQLLCVFAVPMHAKTQWCNTMAAKGNDG